MDKSLDITGNKYGKLTVIEKTEVRGKNSYWLCVCECGKRKTVRRTHLLSGDTKSCRSKECRTYYVKHNNAIRGQESVEYSCWKAMKTRCLNKNHPSYINHGARGITICDRWLEFENFLSDMGEKPKASLSIERLDNDLGYFPENCTWSTSEQQNRNKRINGNNTSGVRGVYQSNNKSSWYASIYHNGENHHLGTFSSKEEAAAERKLAENKYWKKPS